MIRMDEEYHGQGVLLVYCFIPEDDNLVPVSLQGHGLSNLFLVV